MLVFQWFTGIFLQCAPKSLHGDVKLFDAQPESMSNANNNAPNPNGVVSFFMVLKSVFIVVPLSNTLKK